VPVELDEPEDEDIIQLNVTVKNNCGQEITDSYNMEHPIIVIDDPTSIIESSDNSFVIVPNPVRDIITVSFEQESEMPIKVELCELSGQCIINLFEGMSNAGLNKFDFNLTKMGIATGSYFIKITDNNGTKSKQFIFAK
jgi:hypothetical protein